MTKTIFKYLEQYSPFNSEQHAQIINLKDQEGKGIGQNKYPSPAVLDQNKAITKNKLKYTSIGNILFEPHLDIL